MCGIFGYIGRENIDVKSAVDEIIHRGPDGDGFFTYDIVENKKYNEIKLLENNNRRVYFGFRRLAIIDISTVSNQPFTREDLNLTIIFNGEIYNYIELKNELVNYGYVFSTYSDTEVLLCAYHYWGEECLNKFNGMWAFSILDSKKSKIFCSRDRFGVKPFYYYQDNNQIFFASEIKQFFKVNVQREINENVLLDFLDKSLVDHTSETFFKNIFTLRGGEKFSIDINDIDKTIEPVRWYDLKANIKDELEFEKDDISFASLLEDSIKLRFRSDVSVGSCLSGGLDSSSIVSFSAKLFEKKDISVFNASFSEKQFDESEYAKMVVNKYNNIHINYCSLSADLIVAELEKVIYHQDEPFSDFGILSQWEIMKLAQSTKTTVLLDGQGGDEILAGYRKYYAFYLKELLFNGKVFIFMKEFFYLLRNRQFNFFDLEGIKRYLKPISVNKAINTDRNLKPMNSNFGFDSSNSIVGKSIDDFNYFSIPALLRYEDRNSMAFSIEARVPFLDYRLVEYTIGLPAKYKIRNGLTKWLLRTSMKGILPDGIRNRISKLGFATPQSVWLQSNATLRDYFLKHFESMQNPYLNNEYIYQQFKSYPSNEMSSEQFSKYLIFDLWYNFNFNKNN